MRTLRIFGLACVVALAGSAARAQEKGIVADAPEPWGTTTLSVLNLNAFAFTTFDGTSVPGGDSTAARFIVSGGRCFEAPILLPTGAVIDHTELEGCDTDAGNIESSLFGCSDGPCFEDYVANTTGTPGCIRLASPGGSRVVQNTATTYFEQVCMGAFGNTNSFRSVRVFYRLQVSPAPAVATFPNDVPTTHPFFRFVQAMAASGLTGGCGAGSFCPDQPVTRGQMSVFLASALGLHFPN